MTEDDLFNRLRKHSYEEVQDAFRGLPPHAWEHNSPDYKHWLTKRSLILQRGGWTQKEYDEESFKRLSAYLNDR